MKSHVPTAHLSPSSNEYVLDLLSVSEEKLLKLLEELDGRQLADILHQMEEEEVYNIFCISLTILSAGCSILN